MRLNASFLPVTISVEKAKQLTPNFSDAEAFPEKTSSIALDVSGPIEKWQTDFLFNYQVFPPYVMQFVSEWQYKKEKMQLGHVIMQRALFPPLGFGFCMEFAVRICHIFASEKQLGFAYETLSDHVESGISEFYLEEKQGELFFTIHTFSQPGHWSTRFAKQFISLPYQAWCTRRALSYVKRRFHEENNA